MSSALSEFQPLTVIGSDPLFSHFRPTRTPGKLKSQFFCISPVDAPEAFSKIADIGAKIVLVNPFDYHPNDLSLLPTQICLWFLGRLARDPGLPIASAPNLSRIADYQVDQRRENFEAIDKDQILATVVSDSDSFDLLSGSSFPLFLSPPPVAFDEDSTLWPSPPFEEEEMTSDRLKYFSAYADALNVDASSWVDFPTRGFQMVGIRDLAVVISGWIAGEFPYGAAVALARGLALISPAVRPRWGLEPGIDFLEYSTPHELQVVLQYLRRNPRILHLMRQRGEVKGRVFESDKIFARVIGGLGR